MTSLPFLMGASRWFKFSLAAGLMSVSALASESGVFQLAHKGFK